MGDGVDRCKWCMNNELSKTYHDVEWGTRVVDDDRTQFEHLSMEVLQCGLNWQMMLDKREVFKACFANFEVATVAKFGEDDIERIMNTEGMIKSIRKIEAIINNAKKVLEIAEEYGSFSNYIWSFTEGKTIVYKDYTDENMPSKNELSELISKQLKKRGLKFVGPVTIYSHLQSVGVINDHASYCFRYQPLAENAVYK